MSRAPRGYELRLLILLTLANGVVAFDRLIAGFLSPYIVTDLGLSNAQLGLLGGAMSLAIAVSSVAIGRLADASGRRKAILITCTVIFSLGSALGGIAAGFLTLLLARAVLGFAEGPMVPLSQAAMAEASAPARRGFNMGAMQMTGAFLLGGMAGPVIATQIADAWGWRAAFLLSALPGLVLALALAAYMRRDAPRTERAPVPLAIGPTLAALWRIRNIRLILAVAGLFTGWLAVQNVFLSVYLVQVKGLAPSTAGWVIGMMGIAGVIGGFALPALSDVVGRRTVAVLGCFAGVGAPLALLWLPGDPVLLALAILIGWLVVGIGPLYCAIIPAESVPPALTTSAIGLAMGAADLLGGTVAPLVAGQAADMFGLQAVLWLCVAFAVLAGLFSLGLTETRPARAS